MNEFESRAERLLADAQTRAENAFSRIDEIERINTRRVLDAFRAHRVSQRHFAPTTGYGYDDIGRDTLSELFAELMGCEAAIVRPQIASGTHALALCLFGLLRPGDALLCATGKPYDTLEQVIGIGGVKQPGSLADFGVAYREAPLKDGRIDLEAIVGLLDERVRVVEIQRSRGYDWRPSLSVAEIDEAVRRVHEAAPRAIVMVDNCYGEFTDAKEPSADIIAGSMIKNPGGGLAPTGGYVAGKRELVELVASRLTAPGVGSEIGSYAGGYQPYYQGLFLAPHAVAQALKTAVLAAGAFELLGVSTHPSSLDPRSDIIQAIRFGNPDALIAFIQAIQAASPIDSFATPEPWDMPGYQSPVIMAAGTFVAGASIELSADAPIREPYIAYMQGALTYAHGREALRTAIAHLFERKFVG